jgi:hypothetical protein
MMGTYQRFGGTSVVWVEHSTDLPDYTVPKLARSQYETVSRFTHTLFMCVCGISIIHNLLNEYQLYM